MTHSRDENLDAMLAGLLAADDRPGDRDFLFQVTRAVDASESYARARRRFWRHFLVEALGVVVLLAALWLLSSAPMLAPLAGANQWGLAPPLLLVLLLWFGTQRWRSA